MSAADPVPTVVSGHTFTIDTRYVLAEARILGKGSFGVVTTAYDSIRKIDLAIKRIRPYANDEWDAKHTLREIRLLKLLGPHPNIISIYELSLFVPKTELYMMMELMDCDLHRVIQSKQALSEKHHKCFLKQMLEGIKAMHAIGVFHRDLKPGNILVSKDCQLRITDFGLARFMDDCTRTGDNELNPMTEYVVTRWYRPPELLLAPNLPYGEAVDLWSIGCILAELLRRKPLFPGKSHLNQAQLIFELKGYSNARELGFPVSAEAATFLDKKCRYRPQSMRKYVPNASDAAMDMLESLLQVDPSRRPTAVQALEHPFLADAEILHDYSKEYLTKPTPEFFAFEHTKFTVAELKAQVDHEVEISAADAYRYASAGSLSSNGSAGSLRNQSPQGVKRRMPSSSDDTTPAREEGGGSSKMPATASSTMTYSSARMEEEEEDEGPPSQLPTQQQRTNMNNNISARTEKAKDNPFARGNNAGQQQQAVTTGNPLSKSSKSQSSSNADIGNAASTYRNLLQSRSDKQLLQADDGANVPIPSHVIPSGSGNILTAVRNEAPPSHIPPGSRMKTPKTPSPKKMDQILQKDLINKRRFLAQQQGEAGGTNSNGNNNQGSSSSSSNAMTTRSARKTFPNPQQDGDSASGKLNNQQQTAVVANRRLSNRLIPSVPFPSISARMQANSANNNNNSSSSNSNSGRVVMSHSARGARSSSSSNDLKNYVESQQHAQSATGAAAATRSHAHMVNSGSNVINQPPHQR